MDYLDLEKQNFSIFGTESFLSGTFELKGLIRVSSHIEGKLNMKDESKLIIEPSGDFKGEIHCHDLEVFGKVDGKIHSKGLVILRPGSIVSGSIEAENIAIFPGSNVNISGDTL